MKLCMNSKDVMKRFEMSFLNESRDCIFQKNVSQINIAGEKFGPFKKGDRASLPNWVIEKLLKETSSESLSRRRETPSQITNISTISLHSYSEEDSAFAE